MRLTRIVSTSPRSLLGYLACACGSFRKAHDFILTDGLITNSLCVHYLAWHRDEVPHQELDKVAKLSSGEVEPDPSDPRPPLSKTERASRVAAG